MKVNAPEKIYLTQLMLFAAPTISSSDNDVEYTRTDAFIKKACFWLELNLSDRPKEDIKFWLEDFRQYMEE